MLLIDKHCTIITVLYDATVEIAHKAKPQLVSLGKSKKVPLMAKLKCYPPELERAEKHVSINYTNPVVNFYSAIVTSFRNDEVIFIAGKEWDQWIPTG